MENDLPLQLGLVKVLCVTQPGHLCALVCGCPARRASHCIQWAQGTCWVWIRQDWRRVPRRDQENRSMEMLPTTHSLKQQKALLFSSQSFYKNKPGFAFNKAIQGRPSDPMDPTYPSLRSPGVRGAGGVGFLPRPVYMLANFQGHSQPDPAAEITTDRPRWMTSGK